MKPKSFVENAANSLTVRRIPSRLLPVVAGWLGVGAIAPLAFGQSTVGSFVLAVLMVVGAVLLGLASRAMRRRVQSGPVRLGFSEPSSRGFSTPTTAWGVPAGIAALFAVLALSTITTNPRQSLTVGLTGLVAVVVLGSMGAVTDAAFKSKWRDLDALLQARPDVVAQFQQFRDSYPAHAPFPFAVPSDGVRIP